MRPIIRKDFAKKVRDLVYEEYPYPGCYTACDAVAQGSEHYEVLYAHPSTGDKHWSIKERKTTSRILPGNLGTTWIPGPPIIPPSRVARHWGSSDDGAGPPLSQDVLPLYYI